ncbi:hypothetical protein N7539_004314 [Penicillium diatomitis]|uniref:Uncharacterized protein n=1 Tax=Penicillium diatomitis TaxID=2819901 RepID=A0A9W9XDS2_9EURO|nr:uncharacterized protein N7539_004314 [Penicillium diatomitis]KAJ5489424.1 hypothetical protein N7539_004314 [Penicillium diatomitis]
MPYPSPPAQPPSPAAPKISGHENAPINVPSTTPSSLPSPLPIPIPFTTTTLHPKHITRSTFHHLLTCYPTTVRNVHRNKALLKLWPKKIQAQAQARSRGKAEKIVPVWGKIPVEIESGQLGDEERESVRAAVDAFLELDGWRYAGVSRAEMFGKEELVRTMEWKLKHGVNRPVLMSMVKSNTDETVRKSVSAALAALSTGENPLSKPDEAFPNDSLDAFGPVRGVGVATASLILSLLTATSPEKEDGNGQQTATVKQEVPFFSDDVYLWLCLEDFPEPTSGDEQDGQGTETKHGNLPEFNRPNVSVLNVKYNLAEYGQLWESCWAVHERLNRAAEEGKPAGMGPDRTEMAAISHLDIERAAFVVRNIAVSGFFGDGAGVEKIGLVESASETMVEPVQEKEEKKEKAETAGDPASRKKREVQDSHVRRYSKRTKKA